MYSQHTVNLVVFYHMVVLNFTQLPIFFFLHLILTCIEFILAFSIRYGSNKIQMINQLTALTILYFEESTFLHADLRCQFYSILTYDMFGLVFKLFH